MYGSATALYMVVVKQIVCKDGCSSTHIHASSVLFGMIPNDAAIGYVGDSDTAAVQIHAASTTFPWTSQSPAEATTQNYQVQ